MILYGTKGEELTLHYDQPRGKGTLHQAFEGICNNLERRYKETQSDAMRRELEDCMSECPCPTCQGGRLRKESLAVTVGGWTSTPSATSRSPRPWTLWTIWS